jgi:hypothetical protein
MLKTHRQDAFPQAQELAE